MTYKLHELRVFVAVVEAGTLRRAAEAMNMTQPALSRIVKRLEDEVGEPLFERSTSGMRVSAIGTALLPHAQLLVREERVARDEVARQRGRSTGVLRVGVTAGALAEFVPEAIGALLDRSPALTVEVVEGLWDHLVGALTDYQVDLLLAPEAAPTGRVTAIAQCSWVEPIRVVVGTHHPLARRTGLTAADLVGERWCVTPPHTEPHLRLAALFAEQGLPMPNSCVTSSSIPVLKSLVVHAGFVSWLTRPMDSAERSAGLLRELRVQGLDAVRRFAAYRRTEGVLPVPALRFAQEVARLAAGPSVKR